MPTTLGSLRRRVLTPSLRAVSFAGRKFPAAPSPVTRHLEAIPQAVICGFEWGIDARDQWEVERRLELVGPEHRGFAYEGAAMAFTVVDAMGGWRRNWARDLLAGPGVPHTFLTYIGIGFAMARLPRPLWRKVLPDLSGTPYYPTMSWLAVDGYGFDRAYFDVQRYVVEQQRPAPYPWLGRSDYFPRAVDQGIGRALWFVHGGQIVDVAAEVRRFAAARRADLWSGVGLAATFAGGCTADDFAAMGRLAEDDRPHVAQGAVFAAKARAFSGFVPAHTETATAVLAGMSVTQAAQLADDVAVAETESAGEPAYEQWRARLRTRLTTTARV